jgi:hypothetical protein
LTIVDLRVGYPQPQADESRTGPQTKPQMKSRPGTRWPDPIRDAAIDCGSRVPRCGARAGHSSTLTLPSNSTPTAALPAADAPTAAPETAPGRTVIAAASAPRSAVPSKAASACDSCHVGRRHRRPAQRRERLGIMRYRRHHQPHARCRKQKRLPHGCHLRFRLSPGAQKSVFRRDTQSTPAASIRYAIGRLGHPSGLQDRSFESEQFWTDRRCQVR